MYPKLLDLGPLAINTYGVIYVVAFLISYHYSLVQVKKIGISEKLISNSFLYVIIIGILGARLLYVASNLHLYTQDLKEIFCLWKGGLTFYGGFLPAVIFLIFYFKMKKISTLKLFDLITPPFLLGVAIARIGCFMAGCCYGKETDLIWGVIFNHPDSLAPLGTKLHPTQLYESLANFLFFCILRKMKSNFNGKIFFSGLGLMSTFRFLNEFLRGDIRPLLAGISFTQYISLFLIAISVFFLLKKKLTVST